MPHKVFRDIAKPLVRAHADRLEREAAQMGAKAIALHAYHQLSYKLTKLGECLHKTTTDGSDNDATLQEAADRVANLFGDHCNIEVNAVRYAIQRLRELETFYDK